MPTRYRQESLTRTQRDELSDSIDRVPDARDTIDRKDEMRFLHATPPDESSPSKRNAPNNFERKRRKSLPRRKSRRKKIGDATGASEASQTPRSYYSNCDSSVWMRSCEHEVIEPLPGEIVGSVPRWLKGTLLRNGPGKLKVGEHTFQHLFDSSALVHKFAILDGAITYQRRFVQTDVYVKNTAAQRIVVTEFGTSATPDPCQSIFRRVSAIFRPGEVSDNSMISVYPFGDEYYTFTENPVIHRIDPKTLETTGKVNIPEYVNIVNHTSHPHVMPDGTVYNVGMSLTRLGPRYNVVRFRPNRVITDESGRERELSMFDQATIVGSVPSRWLLNPSYMHTFGITDNYFVIVEQPLAISLIGTIVNRMRRLPMIHNFKWHDNEATLIHVLSRQTGKTVRTFVAETFFFLHIINQYETRDGGHVVLDVCCYRDPKMLECMYVDSMKTMHENPDYAKMFRSKPLRFVLPMRKSPDASVAYDLVATDDRAPEVRVDEDYVDGERRDPLRRKPTAHRLPDGGLFVTPELICDLGCETPRVNPDTSIGREYRYFYAISCDVDADNPGMIIKVDTFRKTSRTWHEKDVYPSEPIFVADPNGKNEDDGVVLSSLVWTGKHENRAGLLILDAATFTEIARATFETPGPVPKCLHGWFSLNK